MLHRLPLCSLALPCFLSCRTNKKLLHALVSDYGLSEADKITGKTFVYRDDTDSSIDYRDVFYHDHGKGRYLITTAYTDCCVSDSVIELDGRLHQMYAAIPHSMKLNKARIIGQHSVTDREGREQELLDVDFPSDSTTIHLTSVATHTGDTNFTWKGRKLPALVLQCNLSMIITTASMHPGKPNASVDYTLYIAKGIGLVNTRLK